MKITIEGRNKRNDRCRVVFPDAFNEQKCSLHTLQRIRSCMDSLKSSTNLEVETLSGSLRISNGNYSLTLFPYYSENSENNDGTVRFPSPVREYICSETTNIINMLSLPVVVSIPNVDTVLVAFSRFKNDRWEKVRVEREHYKTEVLSKAD